MFAHAGILTVLVCLQVFEWVREQGTQKGDIWRKILHIESEKVYPSYKAAIKDGFKIEDIPAGASLKKQRES